jgi:predicted alpha/beta superfamily hydrolase
MRCSALAALFLAVAPAVSAAPVALVRTERFTLRSKGTGFEYDIRVALPRSFNSSQRQYPVLVLLDADYAFPAAHAIVNHLTDRGRLPEMVVVGIGYADADDRDSYRRQRTRDYTPWFAKEGGYGPEFQKLSGGGPAFARFLGEELLPARRAVPHDGRPHARRPFLRRALRRPGRCRKGGGTSAVSSS